MKEKYVAPDFFFESFKLSQSIAAGCHPDAVDVVEIFNQLGYFLDNSQWVCAIPYEDGMIEGVCYWTGTEKIFTS